MRALLPVSSHSTTFDLNLSRNKFRSCKLRLIKKILRCDWSTACFLSANKMVDVLGFCRKRAIATLGLIFLLEEEAQQPRKRNRNVYVRNWIAL